jgi:hypothetical protein
MPATIGKDVLMPKMKFIHGKYTEVAGILGFKSRLHFATTESEYKSALKIDVHRTSIYPNYYPADQEVKEALYKIPEPPLSYAQGDFTGSNIGLILWGLENSPYKMQNPIGYGDYEKVGYAYLDDNKRPCAMYFMYYHKSPYVCYNLVIIKNTVAPISEREITFIASKGLLSPEINRQLKPINFTDIEILVKEKLGNDGLYERVKPMLACDDHGYNRMIRLSGSRGSIIFEQGIDESDDDAEEVISTVTNADTNLLSKAAKFLFLVDNDDKKPEISASHIRKYNK